MPSSQAASTMFCAARDQGDRQAGPGEMIGVSADVGQATEPLAVAHHDERPVLLIPGAGRASAGMEDPLEVLRGNGSFREVPDDADSIYRFPGIHQFRRPPTSSP